MKLTKGRITKVLSKRKQTMKRCKLGGPINHSSKNMTFRNKKPLNLRVKTLKNFIG
jgi:hypothetical protein